MNYYDEISDGYNELYGEEQLKKLQVIKKYIDPKENDKLLDIGCGSGISSAAWNCSIFGIDPSEKLIKLAKKKVPKGDFRTGCAEKLPYNSNKFDYVICVTSITNFSNINSALLEIKRVGKNTFAFSILNKTKKTLEAIKFIHKYFQINIKIQEEKDIILIQNPKI